MATTTTLRAEMAAAVRCVAAAWNRLPKDRRPDVRWGVVDQLLEAALLEG